MKNLKFVIFVFFALCGGSLARIIAVLSKCQNCVNENVWKIMDKVLINDQLKKGLVKKKSTGYKINSVSDQICRSKNFKKFHKKY